MLLSCSLSYLLPLQKSLAWCCFGLVVLLVAGSAAELLPQLPPTTPKSLPPSIALSVTDFCGEKSDYTQPTWDYR
jgi:hypothetical protein